MFIDFDSHPKNLQHSYLFAAIAVLLPLVFSQGLPLLGQDDAVRFFRNSFNVLHLLFAEQIIPSAKMTHTEKIVHILMLGIQCPLVEKVLSASVFPQYLSIMKNCVKTITNSLKRSCYFYSNNTSMNGYNNECLSVKTNFKVPQPIFLKHTRSH